MRIKFTVYLVIALLVCGIRAEEGQNDMPLLQKTENNTISEVNDKTLETRELVPDPVKKEVLDTGKDGDFPETVNTDNQAEIKEKQAKPEELKVINENKFSLTGLVMFVVSVVMILGIILLILLSTYYRFYLYKHKQAPFEAPMILRLFFPKPVNYEHEITVLCSKYMNN